MFSWEQYEQWRSFPEISRDELVRYFTLTSADVAFVDPGAGRGPADRLGLSVQLSTLPLLGFVPDDVASAPPVAVARLAEQLGLDPGCCAATGSGRTLARTISARSPGIWGGRPPLLGAGR